MVELLTVRFQFLLGCFPLLVVFLTLGYYVSPLSVVHSQSKQSVVVWFLGYFEIRRAAENKEEHIIDVGGLAFIVTYQITFPFFF